MTDEIDEVLELEAEIEEMEHDAPEPPLSVDEAVGYVMEGDCVHVMRRLPTNSVDAIVTDPPYGLSFMESEWDGEEGFQRTLDSGSYGSTGAGKTTKPGIGEREVGWPSNSGWNAYRCANCGHLGSGGSPCSCDNPQFVQADNRWQVYQRWTEMWAREAYRILKPGGALVVFGGTRTHHRQSVAIEDAGFEIRDEMQWIYLSGMPKSRDISKDIDRINGAEREVVGTQTVRDIRRQPGRPVGWGLNAALREKDEYIERDVTTASSDEAKQWSGYGTNLKPAHEPILLARKPLIGSVARNVLLYGTGALNIDATRIPLQPGEEYTINTFDDGAKPFGGGAGHAYTSRKVAAGREGEASAEKRYADDGSTNFAMTPGPRGGDSKGRWPSNILLTDAAAFDDPSIEGVVGGGQRSSGVMKANTPRNSRSIDYGKMPDVANLSDTYGDSGGVSRMFIIPKAARSEKEPNWHGIEDEFSGVSAGHSVGPMAGRGEPGLKCRKCNRWKVSGNPCRCEEPDFEPQPFKRPKVFTDHPTVKPLDLMCHLVRLVCPPPRTVLECEACGSVDVHQGVPVLRSGLQMPGIEEVLLSEVQRAAPQEAVAVLPDVRPDVPPEGRLQGQPEEVLFEDMRRSGDVDPSPDTQLRTVWDSVPDDRNEEALLHAEMLLENNGRESSQHEGMASDDKGIHSTSDAGTSDGDEDGIPTGAPQGNGGRVRADAAGDRGSGSHQRDQGRQSPGEPESPVAIATQQSAETSTQADRVPELSRNFGSIGACPSCGGPLRSKTIGGIILDPFLGSGTTAKAAELEGRRWIGIEREPHFAKIARARLSGTQQGLGLD